MTQPWDRRDDRYGQPAVPPMFRAGAPEAPPRQPQFQPVRQPPPQYQPAPQPPRPAYYGQPHQQPGPQPQMLRKTSLTAAEQFWYVLGCIPMGAMYFAKIPAKKAMHDFGLAEMTAAEKFWYVLMCLPMGAGYFCKVPVAKAITEMEGRR